LCCWLLGGCANTGKPALQIDAYLIDYPPPRFDMAAPIDETIRVDRFTIAGAYNNTEMIFRRDAYSLDAFNYNRWAVNPADMVGDALLRDMRASGLFRAAFSRYTQDEGRYRVQGGIEAFYLSIDDGRRAAVVSLTVTLRDISKREAAKRILFQKKYEAEEALENPSPKGYCRAASLAMERLSRQILTDVYEAIKARP
jgi:ABC-type uncharacterized transport system auxiliary subunit